MKFEVRRTKPTPVSAPAREPAGPPARPPRREELPALWPANAPTVREAFGGRPARTFMLPMGSTIQRRR